MMSDAPLILWFRRDLRLADHPMLAAALAQGRPIVPVVILDPETEAIGAAARWRWGLSVAAFGQSLTDLGLRLILRHGPALTVLRGLVAETGATEVFWSRLYDPAARQRDEAVKAALKAEGVEARSFAGHLLHEPWEVQTGDGGVYKVFTPYWRAVRQVPVRAPIAAPSVARGPSVWPDSDMLADWHLGAAMQAGAAVVLPYARVGEAAALARMATFLDQRAGDYAVRRDFLAEDAGS
ncbi:MAG: deoxyribodipyrimidine photo-lyase, partial [Candidatus Saccharibacteria bacterium]|nr:deoxyribodipyrimidine photo-lyase [Pseudorhodobacter sp.]